MVALKDIEVQWYEGLRLEDYGDEPAFDNWKDFQNFLGELYDTDRWHRKEKGMSEGGYTKVKVKIIWEDGQELVDRIDLGPGEGDFNPNNEFVGAYLRKQNQAMYSSTPGFTYDKDDKTGEITNRSRDKYDWDQLEYDKKPKEEEYRDPYGGYDKGPNYGVEQSRKEAYRDGFLAGIAFIKYWKPSVFEEESETLDPEWKKRMINAANRETDEWEKRQIEKMKGE